MKVKQLTRVLLALSFSEHTMFLPLLEQDLTAGLQKDSRTDKLCKKLPIVEKI